MDIHAHTLDMDSSKTDEAWLAEWLADRDEQCPLCRKNLRGLTVPRCPHCGQGLRLWVAITEPFLQAWIACAAAVFAEAGIGLVFLIVEMAGNLRRGLWTEISVGLSIAMIPVALIMLPTRRRFQRMPKAAQWLLAGLAALILIATLGMFLSET